MRTLMIFTLDQNIYWIKKTGFPEAYILSNFLRADFSSDDISFNSWINWFNDGQYISTCSNATCTIKIDNDIEISNIFDEEEGEGPFFQMNKKKFIKFLHEWRDLTRQKPQTIIVMQHDDGSLVLEGKDFPKE